MPVSHSVGVWDRESSSLLNILVVELSTLMMEPRSASVVLIYRRFGQPVTLGDIAPQAPSGWPRLLLFWCVMLGPDERSKRSERLLCRAWQPFTGKGRP
jgi:hypothetical protein